MFKVGQQVIIRRQISRRGPPTQEIKVGTIAALAEEGKMASVTLPKPDGRTERKDFPTSALQPAEGVYRRAFVQLNPVRRQIAVW